MSLANEKGSALLDLVSQSLSGFKEAKLHRPRAAALQRSLTRLSNSLRILQMRLNDQMTQGPLFLQVLFYMLLGAAVFILPKFVTIEATALHKITASVLFVTGPIAGVFVALPFVAIANATTNSIGSLRTLLEEGGRPAPDLSPIVRFQQLSLRNVEFRYSDDPQDWFHIGPLDFDIKAGEIIFVAGGNGSGKSTMLRVLAGLYYPTAGFIAVDGIAVEPEDYGTYRSLFSAIFTDYHVFDKLYGLNRIDHGLVNAALRRFDLHHKTKLAGGAWVTRDLSTGQKKRLAMIVAQLEDRPMWILDEWAADQDPEFRHIFYTEILQELKKAGKTIVVATHDDRYFHTADRVLTMDLGLVFQLVT
jgi:putative pyoverdin transport system ATP-binding/permease protein